jgi:plasmid stabilization system protein ParE
MIYEKSFFLYLLEKAPLVALGVQEQLEQQLSALQEFPHIGQKNAFIPEVLDFKMKGLPYIAVYKITSKKHLVEILAVLHEREDRMDVRNDRFEESLMRDC